MVIEAATERLALKLEILGTLSRLTGPEVILASNTSSISITTLAAATDRPAKVVGMHFMNPVPVMQLVELIRGLQTSDETFAATKALAEKMGKTTVEGRDMPGFIVNRILMPYINEAVTALYENIGSVEDIDVAMKLGTNVPMGPLTLADFIGLDTCLVDPRDPPRRARRSALPPVAAPPEVRRGRLAREEDGQGVLQLLRSRVSGLRSQRDGGDGHAEVRAQ